MNRLLRWRFCGIAIITIVLAGATFAEIKWGTDKILQHVYHSVWFMILMAITTLLFIIVDVKKQNYKQNLIHSLITLSLSIVLLGGFISKISTIRGTIHLRQDTTVNMIQCRNTIRQLPFSITLDTFRIITYVGTPTPSDYESRFSIVDGDKTHKAQLSMNHPYSYNGYRFYQQSYDSDGKGSVLSISFDRYGIFLTYAGYLLFTLALLFAFIKSFFKKKKTIILLLFLISCSSLSAQTTITREEADRFGRLAIFYQGRITPVSTYAHDFTLKLTGKTSYKHYTAEQVLAGWLFYPEEWQYEPMIKIKNSDMRQMLGLDKSAEFANLFTPAGELRTHYLDIQVNHKGLQEIDEKVAIVMQLTHGTSLSIFPQNNHWYSPVDNLNNADPSDTVFMAHILQLLYETVHDEDHHETTNILNKIAAFQVKRAAPNSINPTKIDIEIMLNHCHFPALSFPCMLCFALFTFVGLLCRELLHKKLQWIFTISYLQVIVILILQIIFMIGRTYVSGHLPMSNGYETLLLLSCTLLLLTALLSKRSALLLFAGQLIAGFVLLVCSMSALNPQITSLMPVLHSPWLAIHVSLIMIAYALLTFISILSLILLCINNKKQHEPNLTLLPKTLLRPALALLALGIISGSVWANISWGRYWGWDPKEVWALITLLVYGLALFENELPFLKKERNYQLFIFLAFFTVLMTYIGVNLIFSGLHSYA